MAPCDAQALIAELRGRIKELQSNYTATGDALTAIYMAIGLRPDPDDDMLTTSVIRDSVLEQIQDLYARIEELRLANALHTTAAERLTAENAGLREDCARAVAAFDDDKYSAFIGALNNLRKRASSCEYCGSINGGHTLACSAIDAARFPL